MASNTMPRDVYKRWMDNLVRKQSKIDATPYSDMSFARRIRRYMTCVGYTRSKMTTGLHTTRLSYPLNLHLEPSVYIILNTVGPTPNGSITTTPSWVSHRQNHFFPALYLDV